MPAKTSVKDEWGFFTPIPDDFINNAQGLSDSARWLFILLRFQTNKQTQTAFPSYVQIKQETGWCKATIAKAVRELESEGWLTREKQFGGNNHYTLKRPQKFTKQTIVASPNSSRNRLLESIKQTPIVHETDYCHDKERARVGKKDLPRKNKQDIGTASPRPSAPVSLAKHPAIQLFRLLTNRYPDKSLWPEVIQTLGETPNSELATRCFNEWVKHGWNKMNLAWLFDWYPKGAPQTPKENARMTAQQAREDMNRGGRGILVQ